MKKVLGESLIYISTRNTSQQLSTVLQQTSEAWTRQSRWNDSFHAYLQLKLFRGLRTRVYALFARTAPTAAWLAALVARHRSCAINNSCSTCGRLSRCSHSCTTKQAVCYETVILLAGFRRLLHNYSAPLFSQPGRQCACTAASDQDQEGQLLGTNLQDCTTVADLHWRLGACEAS